MTKYSGLVFLSLATLAGCSEPDVSAERGHTLYLSYGCAACHGAQGAADGPGAAAAILKPRDLRVPRSAAGTSVETVVTTIRIGVPGMGMPGYPELDDDEIRAIAAWIVSIQKEHK